MKRTISFVLILVMLLAAIPASAEETKPTLVYDAKVAVRGETLMVNIMAKNLPENESYFIVTDYDADVLQPIEFENKLTSVDIIPYEDDERIGQHFIWGVTKNGKTVKGDVLLGTLKFKVLSVPQSKKTTIQMHNSEHTVVLTNDGKSIRFTAEPLALPVYNPHPFTDVKNQWFKEAVLFAHNRDLMNGVGDTTFAPNNTTTRAQLVTVLYRLEGLPQVVAASPFTDLTKNWYKDAVAWAFEQGIVNGKTATTFAPNAPITRQEIAAILYRYAQYKGIDTGTLGNLSVYPDADQLSSYAKAPMQWASAQGLITGVKKSATLTILSPKTSATRAQIATILMRFIQKNSEA